MTIKKHEAAKLNLLETKCDVSFLANSVFKDAFKISHDSPKLTNPEFNSTLDLLMVEEGAKIIKSRMEEQRQKGRLGWFSSSCPKEELIMMLLKCVNEGDFLDASIIAMMLKFRHDAGEK